MKKKKKTEVIYQPDCAACKSRCCRHIAIGINAPKTKTDVDHIRWFLMHAGVSVGADSDGDWLVEIPTVCRHLKGHRCIAYQSRPRVCRDYPSKNECCENESDSPVYSLHFKSHHEFEAYLKKKKFDWQWKR